MLALIERERHGYEIMKQAEYDSGGKIKMGPGTLYGNIKRMLADRMIEETNGPDNEDERRKYYRLTGKGKNFLSMELLRYDNAVKLARRKNLFPEIKLQEFSL